jgi:hypothetical protein
VKKKPTTGRGKGRRGKRVLEEEEEEEGHDEEQAVAAMRDVSFAMELQSFVF